MSVLSTQVLTALVVAGLAACGNGGELDFVEELTPAMQSTLERHGDRLGPSLRLVPAEITDRLCDGEMSTLTSEVPLLTRELADSLVAKNQKVLSIDLEKAPFFTREPYSALLTGGYRMMRSRFTFEHAMTELDRAKVAGVFVTTGYQPAKVSGRDIVQLGRFEGWLVVLDLTTPHVLAQVPISAESESMLLVSHGANIDEQIRIGFEERIIEAAEVALARSCPAVKIRPPATKS